MLPTAFENFRPEASEAPVIQAPAERIAKDALALESLNPEQLETFVCAVLAERQKDDRKGRADLSSIDNPKERTTKLLGMRPSPSPSASMTSATSSPCRNDGRQRIIACPYPYRSCERSSRGN